MSLCRAFWAKVETIYRKIDAYFTLHAVFLQGYPSYNLYHVMTNTDHQGTMKKIGFTFVVLVISNKANHLDGNTLGGWI